MDPADVKRLSRGLGYGALIERILSVLAGREIPVMLLKGTYLAYGVYPSPEDRLEGDLDLLVPEDSYEPATQRLISDGFTLGTIYEARERVLLLEHHPIEIDLHQGLFPRNRFNLPTSALFDRARKEVAIFSRPVMMPDPYDAYAHLLGHFATSHEPLKASRLARDLKRLEEKFALFPERCAHHLERAGLSRAARYAFGMIGALNPFARDLLAHLRPDSLGRALAQRVGRWTRRLDPEHPVARVGAHLLDQSLPHCGFAVGCALFSRARMRLGGEPF